MESKMALKQEPMDLELDASGIFPVRMIKNNITSGNGDDNMSFLLPESHSRAEHSLFFTDSAHRVRSSNERIVSESGDASAEVTSDGELMQSPANFLSMQLSSMVSRQQEDGGERDDVIYMPSRRSFGRRNGPHGIEEFPTYTIIRDEAEVNSKFLPKKYRCRFCIYKTSYKSDLNRHLRKHTTSVQHCPLCNMPFKTAGNMENHVRQMHGESGGSLFALGLGLTGDSLGRGDGEGTAGANAGLPVSAEMLAISQAVSSASSESAQLPLTSHSAPQSQHRSHHQQSYSHTQPGMAGMHSQLFCRICGFGCSDAAALAQHQYSHLDCGSLSSLPSSSSVRNAMTSRLVCNLCGMICTSMEELVKHRHSYHPRENKALPPSVSTLDIPNESQIKTDVRISENGSRHALSNKVDNGRLDLFHGSTSLSHAGNKSDGTFQKGQHMSPDLSDVIVLSPDSSHAPVLIIEDTDVTFTHEESPYSDNHNHSSVKISEKEECTASSFDKKSVMLSKVSSTPPAQAPVNSRPMDDINNLKCKTNNTFASRSSSSSSITFSNTLITTDPCSRSSCMNSETTKPQAAERLRKSPADTKSICAESISIKDVDNSVANETGRRKNIQGSDLMAFTEQTLSQTSAELLDEMSSSIDADEASNVSNMSLRNESEGKQNCKNPKESLQRDFVSGSDIFVAKEELKSPKMVLDLTTKDKQVGLPEESLVRSDFAMQARISSTKQLRSHEYQITRSEDNSRKDDKETRSTANHLEMSDRRNAKSVESTEHHTIKLNNGRSDVKLMDSDTSDYQAPVNSNTENLHSRSPVCLRCNQCMETFISSGHLLRHEKVCTGTLDSKAGTSFSCKMCNLSFKTKSAVLVHMEEHVTVLDTCDICDRQFTNKEFLIRHMNKEHGLLTQRNFSHKRLRPTNKHFDYLQLNNSHGKRSHGSIAKSSRFLGLNSNSDPMHSVKNRLYENYIETEDEEDGNEDVDMSSSEDGLPKASDTENRNKINSIQTSNKMYSLESDLNTRTGDIRCTSVNIQQNLRKSVPMNVKYRPSSQKPLPANSGTWSSNSAGDSRVFPHPPHSGRFAKLVSDFEDFSAKPYACALCFFRTRGLGELREHAQHHLTGSNSAIIIPETAHFQPNPVLYKDRSTSPFKLQSTFPSVDSLSLRRFHQPASGRWTTAEPAVLTSDRNSLQKQTSTEPSDRNSVPRQTSTKPIMLTSDRNSVPRQTSTKPIMLTSDRNSVPRQTSTKPIMLTPDRNSPQRWTSTNSCESDEMSEESIPPAQCPEYNEEDLLFMIEGVANPPNVSTPKTFPKECENNDRSLATRLSSDMTQSSCLLATRQENLTPANSQEETGTIPSSSLLGNQETQMTDTSILGHSLDMCASLPEKTGLECSHAGSPPEPLTSGQRPLTTTSTWDMTASTWDITTSTWDMTAESLRKCRAKRTKLQTVLKRATDIRSRRSQTCQMCQKSFTLRILLTRHVKAMHAAPVSHEQSMRDDNCS